MMTYKIALFALVISLCRGSWLYGQDSLKPISGKIIDFQTKEPVGSVIVQVLFENSITQSSISGHFKLSSKNREPILVIRKLGYETLTLQLDSSVKLPLLIHLKIQSKDLSEVVVSANKAATRLVDHSFYVSDYQFIPDAILVLGDVNETQYLRLITRDGKLLNSCKLTRHTYKSLFKDCLGNIHVIGDVASTQIYIDHHTIGLLDDIRLSLFDSLLRPCILDKENNFYFENCYNQGQTKRVFAINKTTKQHYDFGTYSNDAMMTMIADEQRTQAGSGKNEMEELTADELRAMRRQEDRRNFFRTIIATDAYIPVFACLDTIYILNHPNNLIHRYCLKNNGALPVKTMEYHHFRHWKPMVIFDEAAHQFYTKYLKNGIITIGEINMTTGKINRRFALRHPFPKNIKIDQGMVYYLYRLKFTDDKMALYAQALD